MYKGSENAANDLTSAQVTNHGVLKYPFTLNLYVSFFYIAFIWNRNTSTSYDVPPLYDVTIEEFEMSALDRLRILAEIESSAARNRTWDELKKVTVLQCEKYLPLHSTMETTHPLDYERRRDQLSHFVLRLAFCRS
jgi:DNA primase large subunit